MAEVEQSTEAITAALFRVGSSGKGGGFRHERRLSKPSRADGAAWYPGIVADKVWTAEELEAMTPAEQDALFESSLITDLTQVPEEFLERVRTRVLGHIAENESRKQ